MIRPLIYLRLAWDLAVAQLRHDRLRTVLAVIGIALAVVSTTLLASVGFGVVETGQQKFDQSGRDLWVTGGPVEIAPGTVGGFQSSLTDAHAVAANLSKHPDVKTAVPMSFQTLYVGTNESTLRTILSVGVPGTGGNSVNIQAGRGFTAPNQHYADGTYNGSLSREVIISPQTARQLQVDVGDRIHLGGTLVDARDTQYTVVGISPTFTQFLGAPTVVLPLAELQTLTQTARQDRAALITIDVRDGADVNAVEQNITATYPGFNVRTNEEQLQTVLEEQVVVIAAGVTLVVLAVLTGLALTVNLLLLLVYQQREVIAALRAIGVSSAPLVGALGIQGLLLGVIGGGVGLASTPLLAGLLNAIAADVVGFTGLVQTPALVYWIGGGIAGGVALLSALVAGWRVAAIPPLSHLQR